MFTDGMPLPVDATCATTMTNSRMPDLAWTGAPAGTMSFAITFVDATMLPASTGFHSAIWDIPGTVSMLPAGLPAGSPPAGIAELSTAKQQNPLRDAYLGPCPNMGSAGTTGPVNDTYEFRLYAFGVPTLAANLATMTNTMSVINMIAGIIRWAWLCCAAPRTRAARTNEVIGRHWPRSVRRQPGMNCPASGRGPHRTVRRRRQHARAVS